MTIKFVTETFFHIIDHDTGRVVGFATDINLAIAKAAAYIRTKS